MHIFGLQCFAYVHGTKKLDPKGKQGLFVGYDSKSPAYLVYYPDADRVQRVRLIQMVTNSSSNQGTQTPGNYESEDEIPIKKGIEAQNQTEIETEENPGNGYHSSDHIQVEPLNRQTESSPGRSQATSADNNGSDQTKRYPPRNRAPPSHLRDYETSFDSDDSILKIENSCGRIPTTYTEARASENSQNWRTVMDNEMRALEQNRTFELVRLPVNKNVVGGKWVYNLKESAQGSKSYKARYVAKGYSQVEGIDYFETFAPTASMTSVRTLMQIAAQQNLIVHQMDVSTAYLNADIDAEIYIRQPSGYEVNSDEGDELVWKLNKSLYGLKQSGRNWNQLLHDFMTKEGYDRNPADQCLYYKNVGNEIIYVLV